MSSEELAPQTLKERRTERQQKYFKEQVLMNEDTKIIAKTHKGETLLSVGNDSNKYNDLIFSSDALVLDTKSKQKSTDSDKNSMGILSDNEEETKLKTPKNGLSRANSTKVVKQKELKYKFLSAEHQKFYEYLEDCNREPLIKKFTEKLKNHLKLPTFNEVMKLREKYLRGEEFNN
jgi:hypothetical protein